MWPLPLNTLPPIQQHTNAPGTCCFYSNCDYNPQPTERELTILKHQQYVRPYGRHWGHPSKWDSIQAPMTLMPARKQTRQTNHSEPVWQELWPRDIPLLESAQGTLLSSGKISWEKGKQTFASEEQKSKGEEWGRAAAQAAQTAGLCILTWKAGRLGLELLASGWKVLRRYPLCGSLVCKMGY